MIWYICLLIALFLLFRVVCVLLNSKSRFKSARALLYVALAAYTIYLPVFMHQFSLSGTLFGDLLNVMQMVTLDADFLSSYDIICASIEFDFIRNIYILVIGLLHIIVPIFALVTAYDCIMNFLSYIRVVFINKRSSDVYVFSEMNDNSINLALDISQNIKSKSRAEFIFANTSDIHENHSELFRRLHYYTAISDKIDCIDLKYKKNKKIHFYNISADSNENITNTLRLVEKYIETDHENQIAVEIYLFSNLPETETIIDSIEKGVIGIHLINYASMSVYRLFDEHPLYECIKRNIISVLICGLNDVGLEALKAALWMGQLYGVSLKLNVIDADALQKKAQLELSCPEMFSEEYDINFYQADTSDISFQKVLKNYCNDTTYTIVCSDNDEANIRTALYLRRFFLKENLSIKNFPVVAAYIDNSKKAEAVRNLNPPEANENRKINYGIIPFGGTESVYTYNSVMNSPIEKISINVHLAYEEIFSESEDIDIFEVLKRYNAFEVNKNSNRANALHIRYKLWMLGLDYTEDEYCEEVNYLDYLTDEVLEKLTIAEHNRWMAFLRTEGWSGVSVEGVKKYQYTGLSKGRHNCPLLLMHPYLCDFDKLIDVSNELGLPDATVYDRELIRRIPLILKNNKVNNVNYKIIKRGN